MIEYDVEPPLHRDHRDVAHMFGPCLLMLAVTDDTSADPYPTFWEDMDWNHLSAGRMTTRFEKRPSAEATVLHISVRPLASSNKDAAEPGPEIATFDINLPPDHAERGPAPPPVSA